MGFQTTDNLLGMSETEIPLSYTVFHIILFQMWSVARLSTSMSVVPHALQHVWTQNQNVRTRPATEDASASPEWSWTLRQESAWNLLSVDAKKKGRMNTLQ